MFFSLYKIVEAKAVIVGAPDIHIDEGSTLRLECKLKRATENPAYVFWFVYILLTFFFTNLNLI